MPVPEKTRLRPEPRRIAFIADAEGGALRTRKRCQRHGETCLAFEVDAGRRLLEQGRFVGVVLSTTLAGPATLDLAGLARANSPLAPVLFLRREDEVPPARAVLRRYRATSVPRNAPSGALHAFLTRVALVGVHDDAVRHARKRRAVAAYGLDPQQTEMLTLLVDGVHRVDARDVVDMEAVTFDHRKSDLRRAVHPTDLDDLVAQITAPTRRACAVAG